MGKLRYQITLIAIAVVTALGMLAVAAYGMDTKVIQPVRFHGELLGINVPADVYDFGTEGWNGDLTLTGQVEGVFVTFLFSSFSKADTTYWLVLHFEEPRVIGLVEDVTLHNGDHIYRRWLYKDKMPVPATGPAFAAHLEMLKESKGI